MLQKPQTKQTISAVFAGTKQKAKHVSQYLTLKQKREIITTLGVNCYVVLDHYYYKANAKSNDFSDCKVAKELGLNERLIQLTRLSLIRAEWFFQRTYSTHDAIPIKATVIGIANVKLFKSNPVNAISRMMQEINTVIDNDTK